MGSDPVVIIGRLIAGEIRPLPQGDHLAAHPTCLLRKDTSVKEPTPQTTADDKRRAAYRGWTQS